MVHSRASLQSNVLQLYPGTCPQKSGRVPTKEVREMVINPGSYIFQVDEAGLLREPVSSPFFPHAGKCPPNYDAQVMPRSVDLP